MITPFIRVLFYDRTREYKPEQIEAQIKTAIEEGIQYLNDNEISAKETEILCQSWAHADLNHSARLVYTVIVS